MRLCRLHRKRGDVERRRKVARDMKFLGPDAAKKKKEFAVFVRDVFPQIIKVEALNFIDENFDKQGFQDETLKKWQPRQVQRYRRRGVTRGGMSKLVLTKAGKSDLNRPILVKTVTLRGSWQGMVSGNKIIIFNNVIYTKVHNEGGKCGRGLSVNMPQRQMIGPSAMLDFMIQKKTEKELNKIFK